MPGAWILILLAIAIWGAVHSVLASLPVKAWVQRTLGAGVYRFYRLFYNGFALLSLLPVLALIGFLPDRVLYVVPLPWRLILNALQAGAVIAVVVGVLQTGAMSFIGLRQVVDDESALPPRLVTGGLYRWVRHPLYTAGIVFIWATPLMTANLLALYMSITVYLIVGAKYEERKLLREFGPAYVEYRRRTPMFVPLRKDEGRGLTQRR